MRCTNRLGSIFKPQKNLGKAEVFYGALTQQYELGELISETAVSAGFHHLVH